MPTALALWLALAATAPASPGPTLAREDTLHTEVPEVLVRAPRVTLAEILDRVARGEARRESLLTDQGSSPRLLFQLAVIAQVLGDATRAEGLFRKTLYLDPQRADALARLALLAEKNGDIHGARAYRERAQRVLLKEAR